MANNFPQTLGLNIPMGTSQPTAPTEVELLERKRDQLLKKQKRAAALEVRNLEREKEYLTKEDEMWIEDFGEGLGVSAQELVFGIKDLFGGLTEENKAMMKDWKRDAGESWGGTAGEVVGEIAQFAVPGGAALKGVKIASKAKKLGKLQKIMATVGAETASAASVGAAQLPGEGETRGGNAATAATGAAVGMGMGPVLSRTMSKMYRGAKRTPEAKKLLDKGVYLTPGQQASNPLISGAETVMDVTPFAARGTKQFKKEAAEAWNMNILNKSAPDGVEITELGTKGAKQLKNSFEKAYKEAWDGAGAVDPGLAKTITLNLTKAGGKLGKKDKRILSNVIDDMVDITNRGDPSAGHVLDNMLRKEISAAGSKNYRMTEILKNARESLRKGLPEDSKAALDAIDAKYPRYLTTKDAVSRAKQTDGLFTPAQLTTSVGKIGKTQEQVGDAALQEAARVGRKTIGRKEGGQPLEWFRRVAGAAPSPPGMKGLGRTLMGETSPQQGMQRIMGSDKAKALREVISAGGVGAALETSTGVIGNVSESLNPFDTRSDRRMVLYPEDLDNRDY